VEARAETGATHAALRVAALAHYAARALSRDGKQVLVEKGTEGYSTKEIKGKMMWRASDTSELHFNNCRVPHENILGSKGQGSRIIMSTLDSGRLSIGAMGLGCAQGAYDMALSYATKRKQFGKYIAGFQAVAFKLADIKG